MILPARSKRAPAEYCAVCGAELNDDGFCDDCGDYYPDPCPMCGQKLFEGCCDRCQSIDDEG